MSILPENISFDKVGYLDIYFTLCPFHEGRVQASFLKYNKPQLKKELQYCDLACQLRTLRTMQIRRRNCYFRQISPSPVDNCEKKYGNGGFLQNKVKVVTFYLQVVKTDGLYCAPMREKSSWREHIDYYGIAASVYCVLFGQYMDIVKVKLYQE